MTTTKEYVAAKLPRRSPLSNKGTYGRVLLACGSGDMRGAAALATLKDGDKILISEGCTHHRQCGDTEPAAYV